MTFVRFKENESLRGFFITLVQKKKRKKERQKNLIADFPYSFLSYTSYSSYEHFPHPTNKKEYF